MSDDFDHEALTRALVTDPARARLIVRLRRALAALALLAVALNALRPSWHQEVSIRGVENYQPLGNSWIWDAPFLHRGVMVDFKTTGLQALGWAGAIGALWLGLGVFAPVNVRRMK